MADVSDWPSRIMLKSIYKTINQSLCSYGISDQNFGTAASKPNNEKLKEHNHNNSRRLEYEFGKKNRQTPQK